jgi:ribulose-bisphosphate carboxylase small chain
MIRLPTAAYIQQPGERPMQQLERNSATRADAATQHILSKIEKCLRQGCVIRIQHTPAMAPRFTRWQEWEQACCYNGDTNQVFDAIERCREAHWDHHVRLVMEDYSCHSRFAFVVHNPVPAAA